MPRVSQIMRLSCPKEISVGLRFICTRSKSLTIFLHNLTTPTLTFNLVFYFLAPDIENVVLSIYYFVADLMLMKEKIL